MQEIEQEIRQFVQENFLIGQDGAALEGDTSFLDNGLIDSTGVLELVTFMENRYGIKVADEELIPDNLDSINQLMGFITRKTGKNAA